MKLSILAAAAAIALCGALSAAGQTGDITREILALERQAMDGWQKGNPDPVLAMSDASITYFHAVVNKRLDGLPALKALFESYRGMPLFDSYELAEPKVQTAGETAILTYILVRHVGGATTRWNATQVYQRKQEGWRVIHSHWSEAKPAQP